MPAGRSVRSWIELVTAVVGLLTAVLSLGVALLLNHQKTNAQEQADKARAEAQVLRSQLADSERENAEQGGAASTAPSLEPSAAVADRGVWHAGTAAVAPSVKIDLDALPSDAQWGMLNSRAIEEFHWAGPNCKGICLPRFRAKALVVSEPADHATCATTTGYTDASIEVPKVVVGLVLCVLTSEGRFSLVRVKQFSGLESPLVIDVTTYKKAGD